MAPIRMPTSSLQDNSATGTHLPVQTICFTDLPPEIRNRIYFDALTHPSTIFIRAAIRQQPPRKSHEAMTRASPETSPTSRAKRPTKVTSECQGTNITFPVALLQISRQVYQEAVPILYGANEIAIPGLQVFSFFYRSQALDWEVVEKAGSALGYVRPRQAMLSPTIKYLRIVRLYDIAKTNLLVRFLARFKEAALMFDKIALTKIRISYRNVRDKTRSLKWSAPNMAQHLLPRVKVMVKGVSIEESGVLDLVEFTTEDSDDDKRKAEAKDYNGRVRDSLKCFLKKDLRMMG